MNYILAFIRGIFLTILVAGTVTILGVRPLLFGFNLPWALKIRRIWVIWTVKLLGIKIEMTGRPKEGNYIYIGNHRSYIDPIVVLRDVKALPVAKAEVAKWPLIGYGAKASGIMYVKRESKESRAGTLDAMKQVLLSGYPVLVYPEGTTHTMLKTMEFKLGAFKMAAREGLHIIPMAIEYDDIRDAYVNDDTFVTHFLRCFGKWETKLKMAYGEPIVVNDPLEAAAESRAWIDEIVPKMREEFDKGIFQPSPILQ